jgi:cytochrome c oxidase subunit 2
MSRKGTPEQLCFSRIPFFPIQASTLAADVDALYLFIVAITAFFGILTTVAVIYFAAKYKTDDPLKVGARIHGSIPLELRGRSFHSSSRSSSSPGPRACTSTCTVRPIRPRYLRHRQALDVEVSAPRRQNEINELHVPAGRPIKVTFTSEDVLHSLFFPAFRTKADAIPGRYSTVWFTPTVIGEHHIFCAEYCGTNHSGMIGKVVVMEPTAYEAWLTGNVPGISLVSRVSGSSAIWPATPAI